MFLGYKSWEEEVMWCRGKGAQLCWCFRDGTVPDILKVQLSGTVKG